MSNMYARDGRHGKALRVRRQMRRSKVDKVPGCSLIEIDGVVQVPAHLTVGELHRVRIVDAMGPDTVAEAVAELVTAAR